MTATMTRTDAQIIDVVDTGTEFDQGQAAHIIKTQPGQVGTDAVLEARIMGFELEALCGYKFVPHKDPKKLPVCQKCKEMYDLYGSLNDGFTDKPEM